jgi:hypothetical protein
MHNFIEFSPYSPPKMTSTISLCWPSGCRKKNNLKFHDSGMVDILLSGNSLTTTTYLFSASKDCTFVFKVKVDTLNSILNMIVWCHFLFSAIWWVIILLLLYTSYLKVFSWLCSLPLLASNSHPSFENPRFTSLWLCCEIYFDCVLSLTNYQYYQLAM